MSLDDSRENFYVAHVKYGKFDYAYSRKQYRICGMKYSKMRLEYFEKKEKIIIILQSRRFIVDFFWHILLKHNEK